MLLWILLKLKSNDRTKRLEAVRTLAASGKPRHLKYLLRALTDNDHWVRSVAVSVLGKIGDPRAVPALIQMLEDKEEGINRGVKINAEAVESLGIIGDKTAIPSLEAALEKETDKKVQEKMLTVLESLGWKARTIQHYLLYLLVRDNYAYLQIMGLDAVKFLLPLLNDKDEDVVVKVARALAAIKDSTVVEPLITIVKDKEKSVLLRGKIIDELWRINDIRVEELLVNMLEDESSYVRHLARGAIDWRLREKMTMNISGLQIIRALELEVKTNKDDDFRLIEHDFLYWAQNMLDIKIMDEGKHLIKPLLKLLKNENAELRCIATKMLGKIGDNESTGPLVSALQDENEKVREASVKALDALGWQPENEIEQAVYAVARLDWEKLKILGATAIKPLLVVLQDWGANWDSAMKVLAELGEPATLIGKTDDPKAARTLIHMAKHAAKMHYWEDKIWYKAEEMAAIVPAAIMNLFEQTLQQVGTEDLERAAQLEDYKFEREAAHHAGTYEQIKADYSRVRGFAMEELRRRGIKHY